MTNDFMYEQKQSSGYGPHNNLLQGYEHLSAKPKLKWKIQMFGKNPKMKGSFYTVHRPT